MNSIVFESPVGEIYISSDGKALKELYINAKKKAGEPDALLLEAKKQLMEYFAGARKAFDLPLDPEGTPFQKRDWAALLEIPYGETVTYKAIAEKINCPKGYRAVGLANNKNKISIVIPCHRVVGSDGSLTGYAGGLSIKEFLLELEKRHA